VARRRNAFARDVVTVGDYEIRGAEQFGALARRLKEAGDKELRSELYKGINRAIKPMKKDVKDNVTSYMPSNGIYAGVIKKALSLTISKRAGKSTPGITLKAKARGKTDLRKVGLLDDGILRHPVFGNREKWRDTRIKGGFFTEQSKKSARFVRENIVQAMNDVAEKVAKK
jgi:hypothetical protein